MTLCLLSSLTLGGDHVVFDGPGAAGWRLPQRALAVIGEFTTPVLDHGHYLAFVAKGDDGWYQAPCGAVGAGEMLAALAAGLGEPLELRLVDLTVCASRVMWPPLLREQPMFEFGAGGSPVQLASSAMR